MPEVGLEPTRPCGQRIVSANRPGGQAALVSRLRTFLGNGECGWARDSCAETPAPDTSPHSFGPHADRRHAASRMTSRYARRTREIGASPRHRHGRPARSARRSVPGMKRASSWPKAAVGVEPATDGLFYTWAWTTDTWAWTTDTVPLPGFMLPRFALPGLTVCSLHPVPGSDRVQASSSWRECSGSCCGRKPETRPVCDPLDRTLIHGAS
jgi:hypothetical protein